MLTSRKVNSNCADGWGGGAFSKSVISCQCVYEKPEKMPKHSLRDRPEALLVHHSAALSEMSGLLCRVIAVPLERHMLVV